MVQNHDPWLDFLQVIQNFDPAKFNFQKVADSEVLFQFEQLGNGEGPVAYHIDSTCPASPDLVLINVSPIEYGHVLLVPRVQDSLPQLADADTVLLALRFCQQADNSSFRLCFNSLGAYATINHLHFQVQSQHLSTSPVGLTALLAISFQSCSPG